MNKAIHNRSAKSYLLLILFILYAPLCAAQAYKYIGIEEGLSNQKVYRILQDTTGYIWFLTQEGPDRYNGKEIKHYDLMEKGQKLNMQINLNWFYMDNDGALWGISRKSRIFRYESSYDRFEQIYTPFPIPEGDTPPMISYCYMDQEERIWLCSKEKISLFDTHAQQLVSLSCNLSSNITSIIQTDSTRFCIGTETGLYETTFHAGQTNLTCQPVDALQTPVSELFFSQTLQQLFIGTFKKGVWVCDLPHFTNLRSDETLSDVNINRIAAFNDKEMLIATDGKGIYRMAIDSCVAKPYIVADYSTHNGMNGNNINDVYVDNEGRIWMANYPTGITIRDNRYKGYNWIRHSVGNPQSLVNNQVHDIIEDSDGDLWFGTSNGISLYDTSTKRWHSFLSTFDHELEDKNHIFLTLCELSPGIILAGGFTSGIYQINKRTFTVDYTASSRFFHLNLRPDQYIRDIRKDSEGNIWSGGFYNLKCFDMHTGSSRLYPGLSSITCIREKDRTHMWIGTSSGLYLLDKVSGTYETIELEVESTHICALYQSPNGILYIGTRGSGLVLYDPADKAFAMYNTGNCALISNNIYSILPKPDGNLLLGTENGLVHFSPAQMSFNNWTSEQGLMSTCFNPGAGILRSNGRFVLGSNDGVISFPADMQIPQPTFSPMLLSDFKISYRSVYPKEKGSPLTIPINETQELRLKYEQNTFSLKASSINYDYPSNVLYSWTLEGFYNEWTTPSPNGLIQFTQLPAGEYTLRIRSISNEEKYNSYEQRNIRIVIAPPLWASTWAIVGYATLFILGCVGVFRIMAWKKEKKMSEEKTRFFINTAHDIRTPLTLIKAPLEELQTKSMVNSDGKEHVNMALRNVDVLLRLTTNLINFERIDTYSSQLFLSEYELSAYMAGICDTFRSYANVKQIQLNYESNFSYLNVWFDRDKMDSILKNILSNAMKYTPEQGTVSIRATEQSDTWSIEVTDTGIGIPRKEQKGLFHTYFRGSNAVNLKVSGSGIGLALVYKLVRLHAGKVLIESTPNQGTSVKVVFHKGNTYAPKARILAENTTPAEATAHDSLPVATGIAADTPSAPESARRLLIVEDNDDLRGYLENTLGQEFRVQSCRNGKEALDILPEFKPDLVLSDIMMPEMSGDKLCSAIKNNIETSHIPVLLLTALGDEKNILEGLQIGADDYIAKPFSINILRASIHRLIQNRLLLQKKYGSADFEQENWPKGCRNTLDWKFITAVRENIETHMADPEFTIDKLCALHHMSRSSFYNKLKSLTDSSPTDYIRLIRMQAAARMLKEGTLSITEIADLTGFGDAKYFREVFRKHFGVSPSEYKGKKKTAETPAAEGTEEKEERTDNRPT